MPGGDSAGGIGTGGKSIYAKSFDDGSFILKHLGRHSLSMASAGLNPNGFQRSICTVKKECLDGKPVVSCGVKESNESREALWVMENGRMSKKMAITSSGQLESLSFLFELNPV